MNMQTVLETQRRGHSDMSGGIKEGSSGEVAFQLGLKT